MGDWWNPADDWRRIQQGAQTLEEVGEVTAQVAAYFAQEGIWGAEHLIVDLIRVVHELQEDPLHTIPKLVDHIRRAGLEVVPILEQFVAGITKYGPAGFANHLIHQFVIDPYKQTLDQSGVRAHSIAGLLQETVQGVNARLAPLYGHPPLADLVPSPVPDYRDDKGWVGTGAHRQHPRATPAASVAFSGDLADMVVSHLQTSYAATKGLTSVFGLDVGSPWDQALAAAGRDLENSMPVILWGLAIVDLLIALVWVGSIVVTDGVTIALAPGVAELLATLDLVVIVSWLALLLLDLIVRFVALTIAAIQAANTAAQAATGTWVLPDGRILPKELQNTARSIWYYFKDKLAWLKQVVVAYLICFYSKELVEAFLNIVLAVYKGDLAWTGDPAKLQQLLDEIATNDPGALNEIHAIMLIMGTSGSITGYNVHFDERIGGVRYEGDVDIIASGPLRYIEVGGPSKGWPAKQAESLRQWTKEVAYAKAKGAIAQIYLQRPTPPVDPVDAAGYNWALENARAIFGAGNVFEMPPLPNC